MAYIQRAGRDYIGMAAAPAQNQSYKLPNKPVLPTPVAGSIGGMGGGGGARPGSGNALTGGAPVRSFGSMDRQQPVSPMRRPMPLAQNQSFRLPNQPLDVQRPPSPQPFRPPMMAQPQQQYSSMLGQQQPQPYNLGAQSPYNLGQQRPPLDMPYQQPQRMDTWGGRGAPDFNQYDYGVMPGNMGW